jgi:hypothetical protein
MSFSKQQDAHSQNCSPHYGGKYHEVLEAVILYFSCLLNIFKESILCFLMKIYTFLPSALDGGEWSISGLSDFTSEERFFNTHSIGDLMGMAGKKDLLTLPGFKPQDHQALNLVAVPTTLTYPLPHLQLHMTTEKV